jgi:hypothetical protein
MTKSSFCHRVHKRPPAQEPFHGRPKKKTLDKMMNDRKRFVFCPHINQFIAVLNEWPTRNNKEKYWKCQTYLHISLSPVMFKDKNCILDFPDHYPKSPYDNGATHVKQIDTFRMSGERFFSTHTNPCVNFIPSVPALIHSTPLH